MKDIPDKMLSYPAMWSDVVDLRDFYDTSLGQVARRMIRRKIRTIWPDMRNQRVLGLGYAVPYLRPYRDDAERVIAAMPASQGVLPWPSDGPCLSVLTEETELPFPDRYFDRILMVHAVESTEQVRGMMREVWRVLSDSGRLLVVVPNRGGIWARLERTPFGYGRPYSPGQLARQLRETMFTPLQTTTALVVPPSRSRMVLRSAPYLEQMGGRWVPRFAGVVMTEAAKQYYAATPIKTKRLSRRRAYLPAPQGLRRDEAED